MRTILIDDESPARLAIRDILEHVPGVDIVAEAANAREAIEHIAALRPDLLFLDVEMPEMNGIEMLSHIDSSPLVIFVTAFSEHAVKAFELNALDYVLKPIRPERVLTAVERARARFSSGAPASYAALTTQAQPVTRIPVWAGGKVYFVRRSAILFATVNDDQVLLHSADGNAHPFAKSLARFEELVAGGGFFRISRSTLVNLEAVKELYPGLAAGSWCIKLIDGCELDVPRERAKPLKQKLGL